MIEMKLFKIMITILILQTNVATAFSLADLSKGQSGGTEAYLMMTKREYFHDLMKMSLQKHKAIVTTRVRAQRGNEAEKLIAALSKISFHNNFQTGMKLRNRFRRFNQYHN